MKEKVLQFRVEKIFSGNKKKGKEHCASCLYFFF